MFDEAIKKTILHALEDADIKNKIDSYIKERIKVILQEVLDGLAKD